MWIILLMRWGNANVETQSFVSRVAQPKRVTHTREKCNNVNEEGFIIAKGTFVHCRQCQLCFNQCLFTTLINNGKVRAMTQIITLIKSSNECEL